MNVNKSTIRKAVEIIKNLVWMAELHYNQMMEKKQLTKLERNMNENRWGSIQSIRIREVKVLVRVNL